MEKPPQRSKGNRILKFLPKATSFSIPNPPYSPGRDKAHAHRGFSGPMFSIIPADARRKHSGRRGYETPEPTSPKVSCIGQIKHKKKACCRSRASSPTRTEGKPRFAIGRMFRRKAKPGGRGGGAAGPVGVEKPPTAPGKVPPLGQLRRFASGRDALANFDWKVSRVADESGEDHSDYYYRDGDEDEVIIPHSAPMLVGGGLAVEPKTEVNLWKRRTMAPPRPLHLD